jgi:hypothetical protein
MKWKNVTYMRYSIDVVPKNKDEHISYKISRPIQGQKSAVCIFSQENFNWFSMDDKTNYMLNIPYAILFSSIQLKPTLKINANKNFRNKKEDLNKKIELHNTFQPRLYYNLPNTPPLFSSIKPKKLPKSKKINNKFEKQLEAKMSEYIENYLKKQKQ